MKLRNFALVLSAATLLPIFAYAGNDMPAPVTKNEPLEVINAATHSLRDQVLASFVRDLYREPVAYITLPVARDADPLNAVNAVLRCENSAAINAGIAGDLRYC